MFLFSDLDFTLLRKYYNMRKDIPASPKYITIFVKV